eukprot:g471.t1
MATTTAASTTGYVDPSGSSANTYASQGAAAASLVIYVLAALATGALASAQWREDERSHAHWWKRSSILPLLLCVSVVLRGIWVILVGLADPNGQVTTVLEKLVNRLAMLVYFTAYGFVVAHIIDLGTVRRRGFLATGTMSATWARFWRGVAAIWVIDLVLTVVWITESGSHTSREQASYVVGLCFLAFMFFLLSLLFLWHGVKLAARAEWHFQHTVWLAVASLMSAFLFAMRFVLFLYQPVTGHYVNSGGVLYPYFFYEVPEIVPGVLILLAARAVRGTRERSPRGRAGSGARHFSRSRASSGPAANAVRGVYTSSEYRHGVLHTEMGTARGAAKVSYRSDAGAGLGSPGAAGSLAAGPPLAGSAPGWEAGGQRSTELELHMSDSLGVITEVGVDGLAGLSAMPIVGSASSSHAAAQARAQAEARANALAYPRALAAQNAEHAMNPRMLLDAARARQAGAAARGNYPTGGMAGSPTDIEEAPDVRTYYTMM